MTKQVKIGDNVKVERVDSKGWRTVTYGTVDWVEDSSANTGMIIVRVKSRRIEHVEHPERGRDIPAPNFDHQVAFDIDEAEVI